MEDVWQEVVGVMCVESGQKSMILSQSTDLGSSCLLDHAGFFAHRHLM